MPNSRKHQRAAYRDRSVAVRSLGVELTLPNLALRAELVDLSIGGLGLKISLAQDPVLHEGQILDLRITGSVRSEIVTPGRVLRSCTDDEGYVHYALQFLDVDNLKNQIDPFYQQYFNRRTHERVRPRFDARVSVTAFCEDGTEFKGALYDISITGLGIATKPGAPPPLGSGAQVTVNFDLPLARTTLVGVAQVRNLVEAGTYTLVGLEFMDLGQDSELFENEIEAYIKDREAELTRWTRTLV